MPLRRSDRLFDIICILLAASRPVTSAIGRRFGESLRVATFRPFRSARSVRLKGSFVAPIYRLAWPASDARSTISRAPAPARTQVAPMISGRSSLTATVRAGVE